MSNKQDAQDQSSSWRNELNDLVRGASGGFLFSIPLFYTLEVWQIGTFIGPPRMLIGLAASFVVVFLLNRTAGFRQTSGIRLADVLIDTVEALALSLVCSALVLLLLRKTTLAMPLNELFGRVLLEALTFALGVAIANQFLQGDRSDQSQQASSQGTSRPPKHLFGDTLADAGATITGALFIAFNIAPTQEVPTLVMGMAQPQILLVILFSLLVSYAIVFEAGFGDQQKRYQQEGLFQKPLGETVVAYLLSLVATMFMLWFFAQLSLDDPWQKWLYYAVVLGLPASIGGAAGRLAI